MCVKPLSVPLFIISFKPFIIRERCYFYNLPEYIWTAGDTYSDAVWSLLDGFSVGVGGGQHVFTNLSWSIADALGTESLGCFYCVLGLSRAPALASALWVISCTATLSPVALSPLSAFGGGEIRRGLTFLFWRRRPPYSDGAAGCWLLSLLSELTEQDVMSQCVRHTTHRDENMFWLGVFFFDQG